MSKKFVTVMIVIWSVIIVALISLLIFLFNSNNVTSGWFDIDNGTNSEQNYTQTYAASEIGEITADLSNSDIYVNQGDTDEIKVEVKNKTKSKITCSKNGSTLDVKQESSHIVFFGFGINTRCIVTVTVPANYDKALNIKTSSGDSKIKGDYNLEKFSCKSSSGTISLDTVKTPEIKLEASSGDIKAQRLEGDCDVETSSGRISINSIKGKGNFKASSGDLKLVFEAVNGDISTNASSGTIDMAIKENNNCTVEMETSSGDINSNYPTNGAKKSKTAQIGAGSNRVRISTSSGDISLNK